MDIERALAFFKRKRFSAQARVAGFLVNADIGPICWGDLHGAGRQDGEEFVRFEAVSVDHRNGCDLVKTADGVAYVIVSYADHAKARGLTHLRDHIAANPTWYEARVAATWQ